MNYFISDLHFGDREQLHWYNRPFKNVKEMNETLYGNLVKTVPSGCKLFVVGDFFNYTKHDTKSWKDSLRFASLPFETYLIMGNHENKILHNEFDDNKERFADVIFKAGFKHILWEHTNLIIHGVQFHVVHNLLHTSPNSLNIYGHIHSGSRFSECGINVAADINGYVPISDFDISLAIQTVIDYHMEDASFQKAIPISNYSLWEHAYCTWRE